MSILERLSETIEYAEIMTLNTIDEDVELKALLFRLGGLYKELSTGGDATEKEAELAIKAFEELDPEYLGLIKENIDEFRKQRADREYNANTLEKQE